ncbi:uncharacterized protein LOC113681283 [Pocillopora damicornis]|uniref:uncharacterized protein LOC113681283 n=1 Tax=Pocillopora damicornis TaxID=46731 RepID=UPI000F5548CF|nr:uncharacterized protein LOC113681283 [Pocillopora damicornis]
MSRPILIIIIADKGNMPALIGILLDVSGSMERNIGSGIDEDGEPWARSIFEVIDNLIKYDVSADNHVFAVGFGANEGEQIFDILGTLQRIHLHNRAFDRNDKPVTRGHLNEIFKVLEKAGARYIRKWADVEVARKVVPDYTADLLLRKCQSDQSFARKFVMEFLPPACRDWHTEDNPLLGLVETVATSVVTTFKRATTEDVKDVIDKAAPHLMKRSVGEDSIFNVRKASDILHGCFDEEELSKERSRELLRRIEPYIYGGTPLYESIERATNLMRTSEVSSHEKVLFVLSDGKPGDGAIDDHWRKSEAVSGFKNAEVNVVSCFVTDSTTIEPRRLYSEMKPDWHEGAQFLFSLSSILTTQSIPRTMFVKRDWSIEVKNNETRLFLQVNHPDHLRDACDLARDVVCSQEALSDLLADVDLDVYINQSVRDYEAQAKQEGQTCFAHASATVLHLTMKRIHGRQGKIPDFEELKNEMIGHFGKEAAVIKTVLEKMCNKYRLRYKQVDLKGAMEAVASSRPVVATFGLTLNEWGRFYEFFETDGKGILTKRVIDITARPENPKGFGHAVVLTSFNSEYLRLLNSKGSDWADNGFFKVQNADVLGFKFYDVHWEVEDLNEKEKTSFKELGSKRAKWLMETLPSLQRDDYTVNCPRCQQDSPVKKFTGNLSGAKCPKCNKEFNLKNVPKGNILALNIYLTASST